MKPVSNHRHRDISVILVGCTFASVVANAQPYHADTLTGGVQTLEVSGDLSVKQYGAGYGGDLKVVGGAHFATGAEALTGLPAGVTGQYFGPQRLGTSLNVAEYRFSKNGDETTGDFTVPLGTFGDSEGALIQLDVRTGPADVDSGGAHFVLMGKRQDSHAPVVATSHSAYGGGKGVKIQAFSAAGLTTLYLQFDATSNNPSEVHEHAVVVRASSIGSINAFNRDVSFSQTYPIKLENSYQSDFIGGGTTTQSTNTDKIALNGDVTIATGKSLKIGSSEVLTTASAPTSSPAWTNAFLSRGNVSNGASFSTGGSIASGVKAVALGELTEAAGVGSISLGTYTYALGDFSMASGDYTFAQGYASFVTGSFNSANGEYSMASGISSTASGSASTALGSGAFAVGTASLAAGQGIEASSYAEAAFGSYNLGAGSGSPLTWVEQDLLFEVGNGSGWMARSNAITTLKNGETTFTNKAWKGNQNGTATKALEDPAATTTDSAGQALVVEGHTRLKGKVVIEVPQGDISMGIYAVP